MERRFTRCALIIIASFLLVTGHGWSQKSFDADSLGVMLSQWHALPEASVAAVGLGAGARGIDEVPGALHVIRPAELERYAYTDPLRVLQSVSGVNIQEEDGFGLRPNIGLRGSGSDRSGRITLMEDGVLIAPAPYTAPAAYYFPSIARMSSIEILKGSSQIAFGPQTAGGAINMVSANLDTEKTLHSARFRTESSSFGGYLQHLKMTTGWGGKQGNWGMLIEGLQFGSSGFKRLPTGRPTGFSKMDGLLKLRWSSLPVKGRPQSFQIKWGYAEEDSHETYAGLTHNDFQIDPYQRYGASELDRMIAGHEQRTIRHELEVNRRWKLQTDAYLNTFQRNWYKLDGVRDSVGDRHSLLSIYDEELTHLLKEETPTGWEILMKANNRSYESKGIQHRGTVTFDESSSQLIYGLRFHIDEVDRFEWRDGYQLGNLGMVLTDPGEKGLAGNRLDGARAFSAFIRSTLNFGPLTLTPGLRTEQMRFHRYDYGKTDLQRSNEPTIRTNEVQVWLPGVGVNFALGEVHHFFAGVHRGFIPPGSSPGTRPESSMNIELGYRWGTSRWSGQMVGFRNEYQDLLGSDLTANGGTGSGEMFNGGSARTWGIELECAAELLPNQSKLAMPLRLSYTYTRARFTSDFVSDWDAWNQVSDGDFLPYLAPHQGSIQWSVVSDKSALEFNGRYASAMRTKAGQERIADSDATDVSALLDVVFRREFNSKIESYIGVNNVFNSATIVAMRPAGLRPNMPRLVRIGVNLSL
ncbi:MAG: TonB-dependent receptor family protein [Flavobacteriales bacterium]